MCCLGEREESGSWFIDDRQSDEVFLIPAPPVRWTFLGKVFQICIMLLCYIWSDSSFLPNGLMISQKEISFDFIPPDSLIFRHKPLILLHEAWSSRLAIIFSYYYSIHSA